MAEELYSDIPTNLDLVPMTGLLGRLKGEGAIRASLRHLVLTVLDEVPYEPRKGSLVAAGLFEPADSITEESVRRSVEQCVRDNEQRVELLQVLVSSGLGGSSSLTVTIVFAIKKTGQQSRVDVVIRKVR